MAELMTGVKSFLLMETTGTRRFVARRPATITDGVGVSSGSGVVGWEVQGHITPPQGHIFPFGMTQQGMTGA